NIKGVKSKYMKNKIIILITAFTLILTNIHVSFGVEVLAYDQDDIQEVQDGTQEGDDRQEGDDTAIQKDTTAIPSHSEESQNINNLILYDKSSRNFWDIYHNYNQSLLTNVKVEPISLDNFSDMDISEYHILYLDKSIIGKEKFNNSKDK